jgi:hypothetical protein
MLIDESVRDRINLISEKKYETIRKKLKQLESTQSNNPKHQKKFYPRVVNQTNIDFTNDEMTLLNKGLKYNLSHKNKNWTETLALEPETALSLLPTTEQDFIRCQVANIKQLYNKSKSHQLINTITMKKEKAIINKLKEKLENNEAMITKADKGNSIVIIYQNNYQENVLHFINDNNFTNMTNDPTQNFQKEIRKTINDCPQLIKKNEKWKYINLNPRAPTMSGLLKLHKPDSPIRPVVNWTQAPAYKFAKLLTKKLQQYLPLPYAFNVQNTAQLIKDLEEIPVNDNTRLVSFDITNMYTNVPTDELADIIKLLCMNNMTDNKLSDEVVTILNSILKQNYFQFANLFYLQEKGLAMGSPTSSILSEIYLQHIEHSHITDILLQNHIIGYFRYVDDILIIYNNSITNIKEMFNLFNNMTPNLKFTMEKETNDQINFLDLTIQKEKNKNTFTTKVYRKPTATDCIIPADSCHPQEHKHAAIHHMINRINSYNLTVEDKENENNTIEQILYNNKYNTSH